MNKGFILILLVFLVLLLYGCSAPPQKHIYFYSTDILPAPFPGIRTLPAAKPRSKALKRKFLHEEIDSCEINYKDKQTELASKINCLVKSP